MIQNKGVRTPWVITASQLDKTSGLLYPQLQRGNSVTDHSGGLTADSEWEEIDYPYQAFLKGKLQP